RPRRHRDGRRGRAPRLPPRRRHLALRLELPADAPGARGQRAPADDQHCLPGNDALHHRLDERRDPYGRNAGRRKEDVQSILAPERFTTSAHLAESRRISAAKSSGVPPPPSLPSANSSSFALGSRIARLTAALSLSSTARGTPAVVMIPLHAFTS